jgi:hypothetical protein
MEQFIAVLRRALFLDEEAWRELRDNAAFTPIAIGLLVVLVLLGGIGAWLWGEFNHDYLPDDWFLDTVILGSIFTLVVLAIWIAVIYAVLVYAFGISVAPDALLRVFAVGFIPWGLMLLIFILEINFFIAFAAVAMVFCLLKFGVQTAFAVSRMQAAQAVLAGFAVFAILLAILVTVDNRWATGPFIFELVEDYNTKDYSSNGSTTIPDDYEIPTIDLGDLFETTPTE